jgi:hypothetical protein
MMKIKMIIKIKLMKNNYKQSFSLFFILNLLNISIPENAEPIINYSFGVLTLSLIIFLSILNAFLSLFHFITLINMELVIDYKIILD